MSDNMCPCGDNHETHCIQGVTCPSPRPDEAPPINMADLMPRLTTVIHDVERQPLIDPNDPFGEVQRSSIHLQMSLVAPNKAGYRLLAERFDEHLAEWFIQDSELEPYPSLVMLTSVEAHEAYLKALDAHIRTRTMGEILSGGEDTRTLGSIFRGGRPSLSGVTQRVHYHNEQPAWALERDSFTGFQVQASDYGLPEAVNPYMVGLQFEAFLENRPVVRAAILELEDLVGELDPWKAQEVDKLASFLNDKMWN